MIQYDNKSWANVVLRWQGSVLPRIAGRVGFTAALGVLAVLTHRWNRLEVPLVLHSLIGAALGLLLVFRTNTSYDRFWEGRKLLGRMVNRTRDLSRQISAYISDPIAQSDLRRMVSAFYRLAGQTLQQQDQLAALGDLLTAEERSALGPVRHRAPVMTAWITQRLRSEKEQGRLSGRQLARCDENLTELNDCLGGAERILKTPVPFAYAQHIKVFVMLYVFTAPFALVNDTGWYTPLAVSVVAFALLGIEQIGVEIEDPFGEDPNDLPMLEIGDGIEQATREIVEHPWPAHAPSKT